MGGLCPWRAAKAEGEQRSQGSGDDLERQEHLRHLGTGGAQRDDGV